MILVTGATGLVGGNLVWHLLQENDRITAIRRSSSSLESLRTIFSFYTSNPDEHLSHIDWRTANVLNIDSLQKAMVGATTVYHCAAIVSLGNNSESVFETNVLGTKNIVSVALENKIKKLCFVSSIAACGKTVGETEIDENSLWQEHQNRSQYSRSKYYSEQEVWNGIRNGLNAVIVNPGVILGISGNNSGSSQLFTQVRKGLLFYTNGGSGYVDVRDVVKAMIQVTKSDITCERFVLVGENCSNKDILSWMAGSLNKHKPFIPIGRQMLYIAGFLSEVLGKLFQFKPVINRGTARSATHREFYSNHKITKTLNFQFTPIQNCINDVCKFQLNN